MLIGFKEAYFVLVIPFIVVWLIIFLVSEKTRKEQLIMSVLLLPFGPLSELFYFKDYWLPQSIAPFHLFNITILPEDLLFAFCIAGIGAVIYEVFISKRLIRKGAKTRISLLMIIFIAGIVSLFSWLLGVNSIFSTALACVVFALLIIAQRKDLLADSLLSGLGVMVIMFLSYLLLFYIIIPNGDEILKSGWLLYGSRLDIRLFGVPITELVWGFSWGMMIGPLYEFAKNLGYKKV